MHRLPTTSSSLATKGSLQVVKFVSGIKNIDCVLHHTAMMCAQHCIQSLIHTEVWVQAHSRPKIILAVAISKNVNRLQNEVFMATACLF